MDDNTLLLEIKRRTRIFVSDNVLHPDAKDYVYAESLALIGAQIALEQESRCALLSAAARQTEAHTEESWPAN